MRNFEYRKTEGEVLSSESLLNESLFTQNVFIKKRDPETKLLEKEEVLITLYEEFPLRVGQHIAFVEAKVKKDNLWYQVAIYNKNTNQFMFLYDEDILEELNITKVANPIWLIIKGLFKTIFLVCMISIPISIILKIFKGEQIEWLAILMLAILVIALLYGLYSFVFCKVKNRYSLKKFENDIDSLFD